MHFIRTWLRTTKERHTSPLSFHPAHEQYWSEHTRDQVFGAHVSSYGYKYTGYSVSHPPQTEKEMEKAVRHALHSATSTTAPVATLLVLTGKQCNAYLRWVHTHTTYCTHLATISKGGCSLDAVKSWAEGTTEGAPTKHDLHLILVWNAAAKADLNLFGRKEQGVSLRDALQQTVRQMAGQEDRVHWMPNRPNQEPHSDNTPPKSRQHDSLPLDTTLPPMLHAHQLGLPWHWDAVTQQCAMGCTKTTYSTQPHLVPLCEDWKQWWYSDGSCMKDTETGGNIIGAGAYHPASQRSVAIQPNGVGTTNTINRAELCGVLGVLLQAPDASHIAVDSLTALYQIRKAVLHPQLLRHHKHRDLLERIAREINRRPDGSILALVKVAAHAGIVGNEGADEVAKWAALHPGQAEVNIPAHPVPAECTMWLGRPEPSRDGSSIKIVPLENTTDAVKQHMLTHHCLGRAKTEGIYYKLYKGITAHAVLGPSNQHMHDPQVTATERRTLIRFRTGTLYNTKHAIRFGHLPPGSEPICPLCKGRDGGTHILSGCQHEVIRKMVTARHDEAGRTILKAILKGALGAGLVYADVGSNEKFMADGVRTAFPQIRTIPGWLTQNIPNSRPDAIMVIPLTPRRHWPRTPQDLPESERRIILIEIKYCPDTDPSAQKNKALGQHKDLMETLAGKGADIQTVPILLGIGGTVYDELTRQPLLSLGVPPTAITKVLNKLNRLAAKWAASLVGTRRQLEHTGGKASWAGNKPTQCSVRPGTDPG
ncbi:MAG: hypothetical protein EOM56_13025 [Deltaproteobacteria bacterium]|nr:hypothetical protein [Deltaproteobacteria bacterium]